MPRPAEHPGCFRGKLPSCPPDACHQDAPLPPPVCRTTCDQAGLTAHNRAVSVAVAGFRRRSRTRGPAPSTVAPPWSCCASHRERALLCVGPRLRGECGLAARAGISETPLGRYAGPVPAPGGVRQLVGTQRGRDHPAQRPLWIALCAKPGEPAKFSCTLRRRTAPGLAVPESVLWAVVAVTSEPYSPPGVARSQATGSED